MPGGKKKSGPGKKEKQTTADPLNTPWGQAKKAGNTHFHGGDYPEALREYNRAISLLDPPGGASLTPGGASLSPGDRRELARIYANKAAASYQIALRTQDTEEAGGRYEACYQDGKTAVKHDPKFEKGYFRCALALNKLNKNRDEMIGYTEQILDLYKASGKDYKEDKLLIKFLHESKYFAKKMESSPNWEQVKFKENCRMVTCAQDVKDILSEMQENPGKVSLLISPGDYVINDNLIISMGTEINIVGDVKSKKDEVIIRNQDKDPGCPGYRKYGWHLFLMSGGKFSARNVHLRQESQNPEMHDIFATNRAEVELIKCQIFAKCSAALGIVQDSHIYMKECKSVSTCGGVIVTDGSQANIVDCTFDKTYRIPIEIRNQGFATITKCEITNSGRQAISAHAGANGFIADECMIYNNMTQHGDQQAGVTIGSGKCVLKNCKLMNNKGGGVMIQEDGRGTVKNCTISGGRIGVGFASLGHGLVQDCSFSNLRMCFPIIFNQGGEVTLKNNRINCKCQELLLGPGDVTPVMIGPQYEASAPPGTPGTNVNPQDLLRLKKLMKDDKFSQEKCYDDPRLQTGIDERKCIPCGMSQRSVMRKFQQCGGCKMAWYCSKECQQKDWKIHKAICKEYQLALKK